MKKHPILATVMILAAAYGAMAQGPLMITDFSPASPDLGWYTQNDNVMGGRSVGGYKIEDGSLWFAGSTNTNGGGFSSIRTRPFEVDLGEFTGVRLQLRGDGRQYTWQLQSNASFRGRRVSYWSEFETTEGEWITVDIPFASFYPQWRGFRLPGPELDAAQIREMGLYIYDKKDGPFALELKNISIY